jgi:uncharacterized membrane protein
MHRNILILITVLCWSVWGLVNKIAVQKLHPAYMQLISCMVAIITIPVCLLMIKNVRAPEFSWSGVIWTASGSVLATIAYFSYIYGLKVGEVGTISVLSSCYPALTFIMAVLFLGESITATKIVGIIFILTGIVILGR